ncbi:hypothetical protein [Kribbella speibonae]|uniref:Uncharacterized protein n=1 Tax=Kribbella speibonae TaxID=1572660 RepID=A0ABY2AHL9_9ACTN|nr:hypothetical protein [Kribbella speibonae]TCC27961.1 hypothetical protein E0H58_08525 [Kribbella speibonae]
MGRPLRSDVVVAAEPAVVEALWRRIVNESVGSRLRRVAFLSDYPDEMDRYGVPADADIATTFAGPGGLSNVMGQCFARAQEDGTLFVYWTAATSITGSAKREAVHGALDEAIGARFGVSPTRAA